MRIRIVYEETLYLKVDSIAVIGSFNDYNANQGQMKKEDNKWFIDVFVRQGEHKYKFLLNEYIRINDSTANVYLPDEKDELWSVIIISKEDKRLFNNTQYTVNVENYNICNKLNDVVTLKNKKNFNLSNDKKVVTRFEFTEVTGLHSVTAVWYSADGTLFDVSENILFTPEDEKVLPIIMWFWIDLNENNRLYPQGIWTMKLFIDGAFILEDNFIIGKTTTYSSKGNVSNIVI